MILLPEILPQFETLPREIEKLMKKFTSTQPPLIICVIPLRHDSQLNPKINMNSRSNLNLTHTSVSFECVCDANIIREF